MQTGTDRILCRFCYCPSRGTQSVSLLPGFRVQDVAEMRLKTEMTKLLKSSVYAGFSDFFVKAEQESLLGLVPRIKCQSHTVITIWYHIACNRALALRDTLFVNFILQTLAGKCGSREFWEWKLKGNNESFIGRYIGGKT